MAKTVKTAIFLLQNLKKYLTLSMIARIPLPSCLNVVSRLTKLCQAVLASNEQENL